MSNALPLDELSTILGRVRGLLLTREKMLPAVRTLAEAAKTAIDGTTGAGVTLIDADGRKTSTGFTDLIVEQADAVQYSLGQGPCLTAWSSQRTVLIRDVQTEDRWPLWAAGVTDLPIRSVISTPLLDGANLLGALKVYASEPDVYNDRSARLLELFAGPAATLLASIQTTDTPERISETLKTTLQSRDTISRAVGILMERNRVSAEDAMEQLLRRARDRRTTLLAIGAEVTGIFPDTGR